MSSEVPPVSDLRARAFPIILAGPSGAGKTTIRDRLLGIEDGSSQFAFSVSATTRAARQGEREAEDYHFVTREAFEHRIAAGEMLEFAEVHGELYGTPRSNLDEARAAGTHLLLDIDVQGARQVRQAVTDVVSIFVIPPSGERVVARLRSRASETEVELRERLRNAVAELEAVSEFDYVVVNDDLEAAIDAVMAVISAEERAIEHLADAAVACAIELQGEIGRALE